MKNDKTKATVIAIIALIVVCGGSFIGVKLLNRNSPVNVPVPVITTSPIESTIADITTGGFLGDTTNNIAQTTAQDPIKSDNSEQKTDETTKINQFTTFASVGSSVAAETTTSESVQAMTTLPASNATTSNQEADEVIQSAAVFSDGFLSYMFDKDGNFFYTNDDPWQRNFGFNELYDVGASFIVFYYDTMRCKFNYDNKDWMIQFWKGQYGFVFIGAEIGVYNKPQDRTVEHYDCANDEDSLMMSMTFYRKGQELLTRDYARYWWCTGFVPGKLDKFSDRSELSMRCRITMKDYDMLLSFCNALKGNGLNLNEDFTVSGLDVFIVW